MQIKLQEVKKYSVKQEISRHKEERPNNNIWAGETNTIFKLPK